MHKHQKKWDEYVSKWTWEKAYKKWFWLRFSLLIIALLLSLILAYVYFYMLPRYQYMADYYSAETKWYVNPAGSQNAINQSIDMSTWQTYSDKNLGFEFKYPRNLSTITTINSTYPGVTLQDKDSRYSLQIVVDSKKSNIPFLKHYPITGSVEGYTAKVLDSSATVLAATHSTTPHMIYRTAALITDKYVVYFTLNINDARQQDFYKNQFQHILLTLNVTK